MVITMYEFYCDKCMTTFRKDYDDCWISYDRSSEVREYKCPKCGTWHMSNAAKKWWTIPDNTTMRAEYEYYKQYFTFMYGADYPLVSYEKFSTEYPTWKPANKIDFVKARERIKNV